jgi:hypothetical protein
MGVQTALALGAGAFSMYSQRKNMKAKISAAQQNAQLIQQQAQMNAGFAEMTAAAQAYAIQSRAAYESELVGLQADISRRNALVAEQDAQASRDNTRFRVNQLDRRNRRLAGAQRAAIAKSGVTIEGTPANVMFDSAMMGELDELATIHMGSSEVRQHMIDAYNSYTTADIQDYNASAITHFGNQEAGYRQWQGSATAAMTLANGNMQSARMLSSIPNIRAQGNLNMWGTALQTGASVFSMASNKMPPPPSSSIPKNPVTTSMGTTIRRNQQVVVPRTRSIENRIS